MIRYKVVNNFSNLLLILIIFCNTIGGFGLIFTCINKVWIHSEMLSQLFDLLDALTGSLLSNWFCLLLNMHRYKTIKYPYEQNENISIKKVILISALSIILLISYLLVYFFLTLDIFSNFSFLICHILFLICFIFLGLCISMINSKRKKFEQYGQNLNRKNKKETKKLKKEIRAIICLRMIFLNIAVCFIPYFILSQLVSFKLINIKIIITF